MIATTIMISTKVKALFFIILSLSHSVVPAQAFYLGHRLLMKSANRPSKFFCHEELSKRLAKLLET